MAKYIKPNPIRCAACGIVLSEEEYFKNLSQCNRCDWKSKNQNSPMMNPNKPDAFVLGDIYELKNTANQL